jgi:DNA replication protein DnaC
LQDILKQAYPDGAAPPDGEPDGSPAQAVTGAHLPSKADAEENVCPLCNGAGFVRRSVPLGHPDFGKAFPCRCVLQERDEDRSARLQRYSNLGPLTRLTFANLSSRGRSSNRNDQERFQRCVDDAHAFAEEPAGWLVLSGPSGCGKTHLAAAIANRCLELGTPALFVIVPDLLDSLRAAYHPDSAVGYDETFDLVRNAPVLILDDLGSQSTTPWAQEKLSQIINHRFNGRLPTVVTTGLAILRLDERLQTRLADPTLSRVYGLEPASGGRARRHKLDTFDQPRFQNMTFESFDTQGFHLPPADRRRLEDAYRFTLDFAQKPEYWLMLTGPHGGGKTHLAVAITNYRRQMGEFPYFTEVAELLHFLRHGKETDDQYYQEIEDIRKAPLLVLDDLDFRRRSPWWEELFQIMNHRYTARLPTVVTTPQTLANLSLDELGERLASLLGDPTVCSEVSLPGPLQRSKPAPEAGEPPTDMLRARRKRRT